ncbi:DUF1643 domain-containing protein [Clostridioides sp. GD02377]|uniref:DUF1643 domain-containing protein n=1 Tax=unclassified Clostridioides TaxID=2635829 RepID=UPI00389C499A
MCENNYDKEFVRDKITVIIKENERFLLQIPYNKNKIYNKKVTIIMKNPSYANANRSDKTTNKVISYIYDKFKDVGVLSIVNLFTIITPKSDELKNFIEYNNSVSWKRNKEIIKNECSNSNYIIFAWGDEVVPEHRDRENEVLKIVKELKKQPYCINTLTKKGFPRHPLINKNMDFNFYKDELKRWMQERNYFI